MGPLMRMSKKAIATVRRMSAGTENTACAVSEFLFLRTNKTARAIAAVMRMMTAITDAV